MGSQFARGMFRTFFRKSPMIASLLAAMAAVATPVAVQAKALQCVPYARQVSGISIHGNARTWWGQAEGTYARGKQPKIGAVLAFKGTGAMPYGHVATVAKIVDERHILLDHANWSGPGRIERAAMAVDVSDAGDWSAVRVWYAPIGGLGTRVNPTFGFIYAEAPGSEDLDTGPIHVAKGNGAGEGASIQLAAK
jgi:surface antigen